jgi:predicted unusual protein kinase regulating ubiquinone biosynthesis (AarF/ABC1/UbiB family)
LSERYSQWPRRLQALGQAGLALARTAPSGRIVLARLAGLIDPAWIPPADRPRIWAELEAARAETARPVPVARIAQILRDSWDGAPEDELRSFDQHPIAVTPTSQVHRAALHDGTEVAVKVLKPGVAATVRQDLALLDGLTAPLAEALPGVDAGALIAELRERVMDELDLEHEAAVQRRFRRALRGHPFLSVPAPVTRLSHPGVLVSEWAEGVPLSALPQPDRTLAAHRLVTFVLGGFHEGFIHCDPNPDDVLVGQDGRLELLDFGAVATVPEDALWPVRAVAQLVTVLARLRIAPPAREVVYGALRDGWGTTS